MSYPQPPKDTPDETPTDQRRPPSPASDANTWTQSSPHEETPTPTPAPTQWSWEPPSTPQAPASPSASLGGNEDYPLPPEQPGYPPQSGFTPSGGTYSSPQGTYSPQEGYYAANQPFYKISQPGVIPLRPLALGDLFDGTFRAIRSNPGVIFGFTVAVYAVVALVMALLSASTSVSILDAIQDPQGGLDPNDQAGYLASALSSFLVQNSGSAIVTYFAGLLVAGFLAFAVYESVLGRVLPLGEAWNRLRPRIFSLIGTSILVALITAATWIVLFLVFIAFMAVAAGTLGSTIGSNGIILTILVVIVVVFCAAAVSIFLTVRLLFATTIAILEECSPLVAIKRSWFLTRGSFWRLFGLYLLVSVIVGTVTSILAGVVGALAALLTTSVPSTTGIVISQMIGEIAGSLAAPIFSTFLVLLYVDQRIRRENFAGEIERAAQSA